MNDDMWTSVVNKKIEDLEKKVFSLIQSVVSFQERITKVEASLKNIEEQLPRLASEVYEDRYNERAQFKQKIEVLYKRIEDLSSLIISYRDHTHTIKLKTGRPKSK